jgi:hypothetical protein
MCALLRTAVTNIRGYKIALTFVSVGLVFTEPNSATTLHRETRDEQNHAQPGNHLAECLKINLGHYGN